jgi:hypothetical protein
MMMDNLKPLASSEVSEKNPYLNKINHYYKILAGTQTWIIQLSVTKPGRTETIT